MQAIEAECTVQSKDGRFITDDGVLCANRVRRRIKEVREKILVPVEEAIQQLKAGGDETCPTQASDASQCSGSHAPEVTNGALKSPEDCYKEALVDNQSWPVSIARIQANAIAHGWHRGMTEAAILCNDSIQNQGWYFYKIIIAARDKKPCLSPCPECGTMPETRQWHTYCPKCGLEAGFGDTPEQCEANWQAMVASRKP